MAPALGSIIVLRGDFAKKQFVEHVTFSHLGLECCEQHGVYLEAARRCGVIGCTLDEIGGAGIVIGSGSSFCHVAGNDIAYPGGHAIATLSDVASPKACSDNVITNNYAHHCGESLVCTFGWGSGIYIGGRRNTVSHTLVHDTAYNPMNFAGLDHVIEYNVFHHGNLECTDSAGIYCWNDPKGGTTGNIIRFNLLHDSVGYGMTRKGKFQSPFFSCGIYLDEHASKTTVYGNIVYRSWYGTFYIHGGWDNTVENNIFVDGAVEQVRLSNMKPDKYPSAKTPAVSHPGSMSGNIIKGNIIYYTHPQAHLYLFGGWLDQVATFQNNLIYHQGKPITIKIGRKELSWDQWRNKGQDADSIVADPKFVDPRKDDYRLQPDSPALKMGFKPIPIEKMGLYENPERASWPVVEPKINREPSLPPRQP